MYQIEKDYTVEYIRRHADFFNWRNICLYTSIDIIEALADDYKDEIDWWSISTRDLSYEFIIKHSDRLFFHTISHCTSIETIQRLPAEYMKFMNWEDICKRNISEEFVRNNINHIQWLYLSQNEFVLDFSEEFFEDFKKEIWWHLLFGIKSISAKVRKKYISNLQISQKRHE